MILQRAPQRAIVWGYADDFNIPITLTMNNKVYHTISSSTLSADLVGASIWSVTLDAQTEEGPFQVKVTHPLANGTLETITLNDILFGDVWLCSGQSNMEFPVNAMFNASIEIANANNYPKIRLFTVGMTEALVPQEEIITIWMPWSVASNKTVAWNSISAVCWLYGRMLHENLGGRPIGLIHSSQGGTVIELWSPPEALKDCGITQ
jgi:sialate O-acetylesterase